MSGNDSIEETVSATYKDLPPYENSIRLFLIDAVLNKQFMVIPIRHIMWGIKEDIGEDEPRVLVPGVGGSEDQVTKALQNLYNTNVLNVLIFQYTGCGTEIMVKFVSDVREDNK